MCLSDEVDVPDNVRRIVNNGFYTKHPFAFSSAQLEDFVLILPEVRSLLSPVFDHCVETLTGLVDSVRDCEGCFGKGLCYLKLLVRGKDDKLYRKVTRQYKQFATARGRDFEEELESKMNACGVAKQ
jgi:hypothetical protein